jgi:hypothetical protein
VSDRIGTLAAGEGEGIRDTGTGQDRAGKDTLSSLFLSFLLSDSTPIPSFLPSYTPYMPLNAHISLTFIVTHQQCLLEINSRAERYTPHGAGVDLDLWSVNESVRCHATATPLICMCT